MTIKELYDWTKDNDCLDVPIYKNVNLDIKEIHDKMYFEENHIPHMPEMIILD